MSSPKNLIPTYWYTLWLVVELIIFVLRQAYLVVLVKLPFHCTSIAVNFRGSHPQDFWTYMLGFVCSYLIKIEVLGEECSAKMKSYNLASYYFSIPFHSLSHPKSLDVNFGITEIHNSGMLDFQFLVLMLLEINSNRTGILKICTY